MTAHLSDRDIEVFTVLQINSSCIIIAVCPPEALLTTSTKKRDKTSSYETSMTAVSHVCLGSEIILFYFKKIFKTRKHLLQAVVKN